MILAIYCCGGHGREVMLLANKINEIHHKWDKIVFVDDNENLSSCVSSRVLTFDNILSEYHVDKCEFIVASGEPYLLKSLSTKVFKNGYDLAVLLAPDATIANSSQIKPGCIVQRNSILSCNVKMGISSCTGFSSVLHHDVIIGNHCFIASNSTICGNVIVGDNTFIGAGCVVREEVNIGSNCIIGIGSVVVSDIPDNSIAYGNPARVVAYNEGRRIFR